MELPSEPEEPTSVIRIMQDFDEFTKHGRSRRQQLSWNRSGRLSGLDSMVFDLDQSITNPVREKEKEVELLTTKAKVITLEKQLKNIETDRKRSRIEQEREIIERQRKVMKLDENNKELNKELEYIVEKEKTAREEVASLKKKLDTLQEKYTKDVDDWKGEKANFVKEMEEFKEHHRREVNTLMDRINENEVIFYKNKAEDYKAQLELFQSKLARQLEVVKENEKLSEKLRYAEHKWKSAEEKILQQEEAFVVAKTMQGQLTKLNELRRQNDKYKEENKLLKDSRDNVILLQEKYDAIKAKYENAAEKMNSLSVLEIENEELKKKIKRWEIEDVTSGTMKARSPLELTRMISDLQKSQLSMMEKQGDLQASVVIKDTSLQNINHKYTELRSQYLELQEKKTQEAGKCQRLQRRLLLVTADRDGIRRILNNYDTEISPNHSQQLRTRVQEAEDRLTAANELIDKIEGETDELKKEVGSYHLLCSKLQAELDDLKNQPGVPEKDAAEIMEWKQSIAELKKENENLQEKVDVLEARIEKRHLQGDFDPTKTKIVHFAGNPMALSRKIHSEELENLRDENEDLRRKIKLLEQGGALSVSQSSSQASDEKLVQELKSELKSSNLQNQRLKEVFSNSVQDFRESCYQLFGYKNDMIGSKRFQLRSMYADREDDCFIFQMTPEHQMEMIETDFSLQWKDAIKDYLARGQSIPAFLSSVTLNLFSKQTDIIDTTLARRV